MTRLERPDALLCEKENPFCICKTDVEVIAQREATRLSSIQSQENARGLKIWEKNRSGTMTGISRASRLIEYIGEVNAKEETSNPPESRRRVSTIVRELEKYMLTVNKSKHRESIADFIAKKRILFHLNLSLNTKKEENDKLDAQALLMEEALTKSERMLEEDAARFDVFLKESDKSTQDALRAAENASKEKLAKVQQVKKLNQDSYTVNCHINKYGDGLEDCLIYREFLDQLTPKEWFQSQTNIKRNRQRQRRRERIESRKVKWRTDQERIAQEEKTAQDIKTVKMKGRKNPVRIQHEDNNSIKLDLPQEPDFEDELLTSSDEDTSMYFKRPEQLQEVFSRLEEENFFLIQNTQDAEQALDEMKEHFQDTKIDMEAKATTLKENAAHMKQRISKGNETILALEERANQKTGHNRTSNDKLISKLARKLKEVYQTCGFVDSGSSPSILFMLSEIEACMEVIINRIELLPLEYLKAAEKAKEKKRRELKRAQQQAAQQKYYDERNRKAIERSLQPAKKRVGRQVMYRSQPERRQHYVEEKRELTQDELDEIKHMT